MKKAKFIIIQSLFFFTLLFANILTVKAVDISIDFGGTPTSGGGGHGGGGGCEEGKLCLQLCNIMKVNLVRIEPDTGDLKVVSYYYVIGADKSNKFGSDRNEAGPYRVYGQINDDGTYSGNAPSSQDAITQENLLGPDLPSGKMFFATGQWGFTFDATKTANTISNKSNAFYRIVYRALRGNSETRWTYHPNVNLNLVSNNGDWTDLKSLFEKADSGDYDAINEVAKLADYRIILEPVYLFQTAQCNSISVANPACHFAYATTKALEKRSELIGYGAATGLGKDCFSSQAHGKINNPNPGDITSAYDGTGYMIVKITDKGKPTPKPLTCPSGTGKNGGTEPYNNYYMMISPANPSDSGKDITFNYRDSNTFNTVIEELNNHAPAGFSYSLNNISFVPNEHPIEDISSESNLRNFVDNYWRAFTGANSTYKDSSGDYYIALTDGSRIFSLDKNAVKSKSVFPETSLVNGSLSGGTYSFTIKKKIPNTMNTSGTYYSTKYRVAYCISKEEQKDCDPTTNKAVCTSDDSGTKAVFHENEKLKTCTLNDTTESGFKMYNLNDTKNTYNDKSYCEVACKDDFDLELPTSKLAAAGQYFVLNNYTPKISVKRTCVTTNVKFSEFEADLKSARDDMIEAYNIWQDYKEYAEGQASSPLDDGGDSGSEEGCCGSCGCDSKGNNCDCCSEPTCNWSYDGWKTDYTATNGTHFAESGCDGTTGCSPCSGTKSYCDYTSSELKTSARNAANSKYYEYVTAKNKYNNLIGKFEMCSNWVDNKKLDYTTDSRANLEVTFQYNDKDGAVFGSSGTYNRKYAYNYTKTTDNPEDQLKTEVTYWQQGENTNETYSTGGDDSKDTKLIDIINCDNVGKTCRATDSRAIRIKNNPFVTSSYIKRTEKITYTYHLAPLSTLVPSGRVIQTSKKGAQSAIDLEAEAVPININTPAGNNPYVITVTELRDKVRLASENKKSVKDSFVKQFLDKVLTGQERTRRSSSNDIATYTCNYEVKNDIVKDGDLNFFYRTIDMNNPFPNTRDIGYNWTTSKATKVINNMKREANNYQTLISGDNFSFTMTPVIMQQIRRYNGRRNNSTNNSYSDWDLQCNDYDASGKGYHCYSTFLTCLASGGRTSTPGARVTGGCNSIFGSSLSRYHTISNYDLTDLRNNRALLIQKQDALDGRGG